MNKINKRQQVALERHKQAKEARRKPIKTQHINKVLIRQIISHEKVGGIWILKAKRVDGTSVELRTTKKQDGLNDLATISGYIWGQ